MGPKKRRVLTSSLSIQFSLMRSHKCRDVHDQRTYFPQFKKKWMEQSCVARHVYVRHTVYCSLYCRAITYVSLFFAGNVGRNSTEPEFLTFKEPKNRFQGTNSAWLCSLQYSAWLCSLAGRYDNHIPTRFLALIDC